MLVPEVNRYKIQRTGFKKLIALKPPFVGHL